MNNDALIRCQQPIDTYVNNNNNFKVNVQSGGWEFFSDRSTRSIMSALSVNEQLTHILLAIDR